MKKQIIEFLTDGQQLTRLTAFKSFAANTKRYIEAHFPYIENDEAWTGYDRVIAIWYTDKITKISEIEDSKTIIPEEVLTLPGILQMNLCATIVRGGVLVAQMTSYPVNVLQLEEAEA